MIKVERRNDRVAEDGARLQSHRECEGHPARVDRRFG